MQGTHSVSGREQLTNELLVPDVQSHVPQRGGHRTNHPVVVYPQQLHQDREALLLTHRSPNIHRPLGKTICWRWTEKSSLI